MTSFLLLDASYEVPDSDIIKVEVGKECITDKKPVKYIRMEENISTSSVNETLQENMTEDLQNIMEKTN